MVEKKIRDLQDQTTTMLLHAKSKWPYALREANAEALNSMPSKVTGKVANQVFAGCDSPSVLRHFLKDELASGRSIPKWHTRARLEVYLGRLPNHAQSVTLVLNLATGFVSPQFHRKFDDLFKMVKDHDTYPNRWKVAIRFKQERQKERKAKAREQTMEAGPSHVLQRSHNLLPSCKIL